MAGDDRTHMPPEHAPIVQRRSAPVPPKDPPMEPSPRVGGLPGSGGDGTGGFRRPESYSGAPADRLVEDYRFGELYVIFIVNVLLGIVTLGIYRFWGKTRIRKYVWSHMAFRGERFEYAGTGMELFLGFLLALLIFGPPFIGFYLWIQLDPPIPTGDPAAFLSHIIFLYLALFGLILLSFYFTHVAIFAAYRYRVSRTLWHGIRGTVSGNAWYYGLMGFGLSLLNGLTLGWTQPWAHVVLLNYRLTRTRIGTAPVRGEMTTQGLYGPFALAWVISAVVAVIAIVVITSAVAGLEGLKDPNSVEGITALIIVVLAYLLIPVTWLITVNWYRAALIRSIAKTFTVDGLRFAFPIRGGRLLWFNIGNGLILILSLGLLFPWVILRYARLVQQHLQIEGTIDYAAMQQSQDWRPRTGEGMAEFFGVGVI